MNSVEIYIIVLKAQQCIFKNLQNRKENIR